MACAIRVIFLGPVTYTCHSLIASLSFTYQYVEDWRFDRSQVDPISVLFQALKGLTYLHAMGIGEVIISYKIISFVHNKYYYSDNVCYLVHIYK